MGYSIYPSSYAAINLCIIVWRLNEAQCINPCVYIIVCRRLFVECEGRYENVCYCIYLRAYECVYGVLQCRSKVKCSVSILAAVSSFVSQGVCVYTSKAGTKKCVTVFSKCLRVCISGSVKWKSSEA